MPFVMNFADQDGKNYKESYWRLGVLNISVPDKSASIMFFGYEDEDALASNGVPIAVKQYSVLGESFDFWLAKLTDESPEPLILLCEEYAKKANDIGEGNGRFRSFFSEAKQVS
jgi:hypothetical protein